MRQNDVERALSALATGEFDGFGRGLQRRQFPRGFGILDSSDLMSALAEEFDTTSVAEWVTDPLTWSSRAYAPSVQLNKGQKLLHLVWQDLSSRLTRQLDSAFRTTHIASRGAVLCFFGVADLSVIVSYERSATGALRLEPIFAVAKPQGVFELPHLLESATPQQRNWIKAVAMTIDKLVYQRGVLVHVNRQLEDVFGPSIDTVILGELLLQWVLDAAADHSPMAALEIGPGNGLLTSILARVEQVTRLVAVELNPQAVACTLKNLAINGTSLSGKKPQVSVRAERFDAADISGRFDLVVCNPPYIPKPPNMSGDPAGYAAAVGGLELCADLLGTIDDLLSERGRLLFMTSSVSAEEVMECLPGGFEVKHALGPTGRRVPLDVDTLWRHKQWQDQLVSDERVERDSDDHLWHHLDPVWIERAKAGRCQTAK